MARALAVLGSASDVGKSMITAGICRLLTDAGFDVAPFKAQNMGNQAGVTVDGLELPRAQMVQAHACRKAPHVDMGPVLIKPMNETGAQLIVLGKAIGAIEASDYFRDTTAIAAIADAALDRLLAKHEVVVIEGAGSPVEVNLMARDFVNLRPARRAGAGIVLVVDIDRGGVFAQAKGTLDLLPEADRARVIGIIVNRFRGDLSLFHDGIGILERLCGVPVLAVVPFIDHGVDEEDRPFRAPINAAPIAGKLRVGVILTPRVSNTDDLAPLLSEPDVQLTWVTDPRLLSQQDLIILPGSKATIADLAWMATVGLTEAIRAASAASVWCLGLCGGYQMLGDALDDDASTEGGPHRWRGLGLLPVDTTFQHEKKTQTATATSCWPEPGHRLTGYEIHHGVTRASREGGGPIGVETGAEVGWQHEHAVGTYLHGLLTSNSWRAAFLNRVRRDRSLPEQRVQVTTPTDARLDRWADHLRASWRDDAWLRIERTIGARTAVPSRAVASVGH